MLPILWRSQEVFSHLNWILTLHVYMNISEAFLLCHIPIHWLSALPRWILIRVSSCMFSEVWNHGFFRILLEKNAPCFATPWVLSHLYIIIILVVITIVMLIMVKVMLFLARILLQKKHKFSKICLS